MKYYKRAINQGHKEAIYYLSDLLINLKSHEEKLRFRSYSDAEAYGKDWKSLLKMDGPIKSKSSYDIYTGERFNRPYYRTNYADEITRRAWLYSDQVQRIYQKAANTGDPHALYLLGKFHESHWNKNSNEMAITCYQAAAEKGDMEAQYRLGFLGEQGKVSGITNEQIVKYYEDAASGGHSEAQFALALLYEEGKCGLQKNLEEAVSYYRQAASQEHPEALYRISRLEPNDKEQRLKSAVNQGHLAAQYALGNLYENKDPPDLDEAAEYYEMAANNGNVEAKQKIGLMYFEGKGVKKNNRRALKYLTQVIKEDTKNADLHYLLGKIYDELKPGKLTVGALEHYEEAAKNNHIEAQYKMWKIRRDFKFLQEAAKNNHTEAQYELAKIYEDGRVSQHKDVNLARDLFEKAAEKNHVDAQYRLAYLYEHESPQDLKKALKWYAKAAEQNHEAAIIRMQSDNKP